MPLTENPPENERHLHQVSGARLSCRPVPETEAGRSHPGSERSEPGGDGLPHVSHTHTHSHTLTHSLTLTHTHTHSLSHTHTPAAYRRGCVTWQTFTF